MAKFSFVIIAAFVTGLLASGSETDAEENMALRAAFANLPPCSPNVSSETCEDGYNGLQKVLINGTGALPCTDIKAYVECYRDKCSNADDAAVKNPLEAMLDTCEGPPPLAPAPGRLFFRPPIRVPPPRLPLPRLPPPRVPPRRNPTMRPLKLPDIPEFPDYPDCEEQVRRAPKRTQREKKKEDIGKISQAFHTLETTCNNTTVRCAEQISTLQDTLTVIDVHKKAVCTDAMKFTKCYRDECDDGNGAGPLKVIDRKCNGTPFVERSFFLIVMMAIVSRLLN